MGLIAEFRLRSEGLALVDVAAAAPTATFRLETTQSAPTGPPTFVVRVTGEDLDGVESAFADAESVTDAALIAEGDGTRQYHCRPAGEPPEGLETLVYNKSVPSRVTVTAEGWEERRRFADREEFDAFRAFCRENNLSFRLDRLVDADADSDREGTAGPTPLDGMTAAQREALVTAHEMGYFDVPRGATLAEVAAELDVAAASLSERLRRAQSHLVDQFRRTDAGIKPRIN